MFGKPTPAQESDFVKIERERQKTKRQMMVYLLMGAISLIGLIMVFKGSGGERKVDINLKEGKFQFSVDQPIVEQVNQKTQTTTVRGEEIDFTTGSISPSVIEQIQKENIPISPNQFTGKNLINKEAGYVLTVENPEQWNVQYNPAGLSDPMTPINIISGQGGDLRVTRSPLEPGVDFTTQVEYAMGMLLYMGLITEIPRIEYDDQRTTAFLTYNNQQTGGISYQKLILKNGMVYAPTANYSSTMTSQQDRDALINMVASFTVIGE
jgi:hypothetical protein